MYTQYAPQDVRNPWITHPTPLGYVNSRDSVVLYLRPSDTVLKRSFTKLNHDTVYSIPVLVIISVCFFGGVPVLGSRFSLFPFHLL